MPRLPTRGFRVLRELGESAGHIEPHPVSAIVFGSFARGDADRDSDLDVAVVRPATIDEDDDRWRASVDRWLEQARRLTGNPVELLEITDEEVRRLLRSRKPLWLDVQRDGVVVYGLEINDLRGRFSVRPARMGSSSTRILRAYCC